MVFSVIGSNFGDEGKGLAVDYLCARAQKALVVRHNGGAQSGHTVETDGRRFVFHELSSGSFRGAPTYWAETFLPDLYKLEEECSAFYQVAGFLPRIYASPRAAMTTIDDVLLNMLLEEWRGEGRHGSCGMGINEADLRGKAGYGICLGDLLFVSQDELFRNLKQTREEYTFPRLEMLGLSPDPKTEPGSLLFEEDVLWNAAGAVLKNLQYVTVLQGETEQKFIKSYSDVIFEGGQGLRLDARCRESYPHVTASRTGLTNVKRLTEKWGISLDEVIYVTRSYLTRHGAGPLSHEMPMEALMHPQPDETNVKNQWQGSFRYARLESVEQFLAGIRADLRWAEGGNGFLPVCSLLITHLSETDQKMMFASCDLPVQSFIEEARVKSLFQKVYLAAGREQESIGLV